MVAGDEEYKPGWEDKIGTEEDGSADPPRIFECRKDKWGNVEYLDRPGCAFTRSIGDQNGSSLGVFAEAEMYHTQLREAHQMIAIASDGVWEFLDNQSVCDSIMHFEDPVEACRSVIGQAYSLWLQFEARARPPPPLPASCRPPPAAHRPRTGCRVSVRACSTRVRCGRRCERTTSP